MRFLSLFLLPTLLLLVTAAPAQEWKMAKDKNGIRVYTRPSPQSAFKEFRGVMETDAPMNAIVAALIDVDSYPEWMPNAASSEVLSASGDTELTYRLITDAPWPVQDRDGVYTMRFERERDSEVIVVHMGVVPELLPADPDYVRIQMLEGYWRLQPLADKTVRVAYQVLTDPGGEVPVWMVNTTVVNQPFKTLTALRERVVLPEYRGRKFSFLD